MWHGWSSREINTVWWGNPKDMGHLEDSELAGRIILMWILKK
jgi:hypothetical protein